MPTIEELLTFSSAGSLAEVASHTAAWKVIDYTALRRRTRVGANRPVPGAPGRLFVPREWDEHTVVLTWRIRGARDKDGELYDDPFDGVDVNHQYLLDNLVNSLLLRAVTFTDRHDVDFAGDVVVEDWEPAVDPNSGGDHIVAPLTLKIPAGWLDPVGS